MIRRILIVLAASVTGTAIIVAGAWTTLDRASHLEGC